MKKMIKGNKIAGNVDTRWQKHYISGKIIIIYDRSIFCF